MTMKTRTFIAGSVALLLLAGLSAQAADATRLYAKGGKVRIEGTSNIHDWQVESSMIGGWLEVGPNFPLEPGQTAAPGNYEAKAQPFVMIRSLKSKKEDGSPYSDPMDNVMYEHMRATNNPAARVTFQLNELTLKETAKSKDAPYVFEAKGELGITGVTNKVTLALNILPQGDKKLNITGTSKLKMTDFKIEPPAPKLAMGLIKTGDEVTIKIDWNVAPRAVPAGK